MKKLLTFMLMLAITAVPALATTECGDGEAWQEDYAPGYYTQGECLTWSETECVSGHWRCNRWGWHGCKKWSWSCHQYSEPECLEYEQIWHPEVDNGTCTTLPEGPQLSQPECRPNEDFAGSYTPGHYVGETWIAGVWNYTCTFRGGASYLQTVPRVSSDITWNNRTAQFITSAFGQAGILLRPVSDQSDTFPRNSYDHVYSFYTGYRFTHNNLWGYTHNIISDVVATAHCIPIPTTVPPGEYKVRPYFYPTGSYVPVFGPETIIDL